MKNTLIELLRFVFASVILLFHASVDANIIHNSFSFLGGVSFFRYGYLGVEFFFVVSGYCLAQTAFKKNSINDGREGRETKNLGSETMIFIYYRIKSVLPIYFISCILVSVYFLICGKGLTFIIERLPSLLLLQRTGIVDKEYIGLAWYLCKFRLTGVLVPLPAA